MDARHGAVAGEMETPAVRFGDGYDQGADDPKAIGGRGRRPPVGCCRPGRRQSHSLRQHSHPARFVAGAGNLWHTSAHKGSPLFRRRAPAPNTVDRSGLLTARAATRHRQVVRRPLAIDASTSTMAGAWARPAEQRPSVPLPGIGRTGRAHRRRRECALGCVPQARDVCLAGSEAAGAAEGIADVRAPWRWTACAAHRACPARTRPAACPCNPGSDCTTRTHRSCRCAGASVRRTAGSSARAAA